MDRANRVQRFLPLMCGLVLWSALPAHADVVTFRLSGEIATVPTALWPLVDSASGFTPFSADVTWDTDRDVSLEMNDGAGALYFQGVTAFTATIVDTTYTMVRANQGQLWVFNDSDGTDRVGSYLELSYGDFNGPEIGPQQYLPWNVEFGLSFDTNAWDAGRLPGEIRSPSPITGHMNFYFETPTQDSGGIVTGRVTGVQQVPEPTTLMLVGAGAATALWSRRRSRAAAAESPRPDSGCMRGKRTATRSAR